MCPVVAACMFLLSVRSYVDAQPPCEQSPIGFDWGILIVELKRTPRGTGNNDDNWTGNPLRLLNWNVRHAATPAICSQCCGLFVRRQQHQRRPCNQRRLHALAIAKS